MQPTTPDICKEFYGFRDMPFSMAVDGVQNNIFFSQNFERSLAILVSSLDKYVTLTLVIGDEGVGKTTLIDYLFNHIRQDFIVGKIGGQITSAHELLQHTLVSFGLTPEIIDEDALLHRIHDFLSAEFEKQNGQSSLLIIDDVDSMSFDSLNGIELLLGLNNEHRQLLQVILVGNPEIEQMLNMARCHKLSRTARTHCLVQAFTEEETQLYIHQRLGLVGIEGKKLFDEKVCSVIFNYSKGIPLKVNSICNEALLLSSSTKIRRISAELISEAANDSAQTGLFKQRRWQNRLHSPSSSNGSGKGKHYKSVLVTGLIFTGSFFILIWALLGDSFFSLLGEQSFEISQDADRSLTNHINDTNVTDTVNLSLPAQKEKQWKSLAKNQQILKENIPNRKTEKIKKRELVKTGESDSERKHGLVVADGDLFTRKQSRKKALKGNKHIVNVAKLAVQDLHQEVKQNTRKTVPISPKSEVIQKSHQQKHTNHERTKQLSGVNQKIKGAKKKSSRVMIANQTADKNLDALPQQKQITRIREQDIVELKRDQEEIFAAFEIKKTIANKLKTLLNQAENYRKAQQLLIPPGKNAFEAYSKVLQIDPHNFQAKNGLITIAKYYQAMAEKALANDNINHALDTANEGLEVFPNNQELLALREKIVSQKNEQLKNSEVPDKSNLKESDRRIRAFATF